MDIDQLLKEVDKLVPSKGQPKKLNRGDNSDVYIWQNRPVPYINWKEATDVVYVNVFKPRVLPHINIGEQSVVLHNHDPFTKCLRNRYCHTLGYEVPSHIEDEFMKVWGYLYQPDEATNKLRFF